MVFSSTVFLLIFLPVVAGIYFLCPRKARNTVLLLFSLVFYGWGEPKYILIMLFSTVFDYTNARLIGHFQDAGRDKAAKTVLIVDLVGNLGILGFFKYTDFAIDNLNSLLNAGIPALGLALPYRHQLLYVPDHVLHHRRVPGHRQAPEEHPQRGRVCDAVPPADRRAYRPVQDGGARADVPPGERVRGQPGHAALCGGPCQKRC